MTMYLSWATERSIVCRVFQISQISQISQIKFFVLFISFTNERWIKILIEIRNETIKPVCATFFIREIKSVIFIQWFFTEYFFECP